MDNIEQLIEHYQVARLSLEQEEKLKQLESELGFTLIAYRNTEEISENDVINPS
ncbi:hypothetical protein [Lysinibacillus yapensis]|uniref:hypothetical protein n=1 Tax=Ureibacillus yapensis TaxID=2304605 RepID=UPI001314753C|nr:hypothetical protein [Lysinibacillus yapensis]